MSEAILVGTRKGLFIIARQAGKWRVTRRMFLGDHVNIVMADSRDGAMYASLYHGHFGTKLHRSQDGGESWAEVACPEYPEKPDDVDEPPNPVSGLTTPWSLQKIWCLQQGGLSRPGELWCGTIPGGLFRSANRGDAWEMVRPLWDLPERSKWMGGGEDYAGIHSICVDPRDPDRICVGVSVGGVWSSRDGGQHWSVTGDGMVADYMPPELSRDPNVQDPHCLVQCPAQPDKMWIQHHNGVFVSRDGGGSWQRIEAIQPSTFGFPVAVHPHDGDTAWLVPAISDQQRVPVDGRLVVTRTRDGGKSWEQLRAGLPDTDVYDVVFRHALDVDATGNRLAFGSTTGSLWVSEDQGDHWTNISCHLPPVYCVRFA